MTSQPSRTEELFCGRYAIEGEERPGGMSIVVKAYDIKSLCHVAIKRMKPNANPVRQKDLFMREHYALKVLCIPIS